ncbi:response regulator transcription factor, partial [Intestinibacillus massiliensis]|nr:response regulator transcription factor [Intestinibacillus massiliensis]
RKTSQVPVIMLTARDAVMDKVSGLDMGADDYITKPFAIEELLARIRVALKKAVKTDAPARSDQENRLVYGQLSMDTARHTVTYGDTAIDLTKREFLLLRTLLENKSIVMSRDTLLERVWGYDYMGETNVVDV